MIIKVTNENQRSLNVKGKYSLYYEVGKITETIPGTMGIFCFRDKNNFPWNIFVNNKFFEVEGIGKPGVEKWLPFFLRDNNLDSYYKNEGGIPVFKIGPNVILFKAIKVIREISREELLGES